MAMVMIHLARAPSSGSAASILRSLLPAREHAFAKSRVHPVAKNVVVYLHYKAGTAL